MPEPSCGCALRTDSISVNTACKRPAICATTCGSAASMSAASLSRIASRPARCDSRTASRTVMVHPTRRSCSIPSDRLPLARLQRQ